jgi:hypothetical protein
MFFHQAVSNGGLPNDLPELCPFDMTLGTPNVLMSPKGDMSVTEVLSTSGTGSLGGARFLDL